MIFSLGSAEDFFLKEISTINFDRVRGKNRTKRSKKFFFLYK